MKYSWPIGILAALLGALAAYWRRYINSRPHDREIDDFSTLPAVTIDHTMPESPPVSPQEPATAPLPPNSANMPSTLLWDTKANIRHSVRVICDEEGLTFDQKNQLCATIQCESDFVLTARRDNYANGKVWSSDFGLCQWNDYFHGKEITADEAVHNPEKAVRLMCRYFKKGMANQWVCHSRGLYKQYL